MMRTAFLPIAAALCFSAIGCGPPEDEKGMRSTASGLKILDLAEGNGDSVQAGDVVEIHYTGTLRADGSKFESSYERREPAEFQIGVGKLIKGWDEGIVGMKPGGKRKLIVPANLAYGDRSSPKIPANSDLVFEVELIRIKPSVPRVTKLEIDDVKKGTGEGVKNGDMVEVHYTGRLKSNGKKFDSSLDRGEPFSFKVGGGQVIRGWDEGLIGMKVGGQRRLSIPANMGYGARGVGADIPPDADLEFDIELLRIK